MRCIALLVERGMVNREPFLKYSDLAKKKSFVFLSDDKRVQDERYSTFLLPWRQERDRIVEEGSKF